MDVELKRREFLGKMGLGAAGALAAAGLGTHGARAEKKRPNIVVLFADDLGYADLSCYPGGVAQTPVLDRLAAEGARFTDFYAGSTVCSPSRASMLTGRFALRTGVYSWIHNTHTMHLPASEQTYGRVLRDAGYDTAHLGKWHLGYALYDGPGEGPHTGQGDTLLQGDAPGPNPKDHGFDYWVATANNAYPSHENPENFVRNGKTVGTLEGYASHLLVDEAIEWLQTERDPAKPFLLNLWFHEPHASGGPAAPSAFTERYADERRPTYHGAISYLDKAVGRLLAKLGELGETDNTLVVFTSDNGSYLDGSNAPLRGRKTELWEGGIRVPAIFYWPGQIAPGQVITAPACVVDMLPTICDIVGVDVPADRAIDGVSLWPLFQGGDLERDTPLYWFYSPSRPVCVIRDGDWALVADPTIELPTQNMFLEEFIGDIKATELENFRLYNLRTDPGQQQDVAQEHPDRYQAMKRTMLRLHREVVDEAVDWRTFSW